MEGVDINGSYDIRFEVSDIGRRYHGVKLTIYFQVEAHREPGIKSEVYKKGNRALVESEAEFHREAPGNKYGRAHFSGFFRLLKG